MSVTAAEVKALRDRTGAGMMDAKTALTEASGDVDKAIEILRVKGQAQAAKRADREAAEGVVASYIHSNNKVGVLVEVNCETDFVARNDDFVAFAREVALHIAAMGPSVVSADDVPDEHVEQERKIAEDKAREQGKPEDVIPKIVEGQVMKWRKEISLLDQAHVNADKHEGKTIEELRQAIAAKTGENIRIARFVRFAIGD